MWRWCQISNRCIYIFFIYRCSESNSASFVSELLLCLKLLNAFGRAEDGELSYSTTPVPVLEPLVAESIVLSPSAETLRGDAPSPTSPPCSRASEPEDDGKINSSTASVLEKYSLPFVLFLFCFFKYLLCRCCSWLRAHLVDSTSVSESAVPFSIFFLFLISRCMDHSLSCSFSLIYYVDPHLLTMIRANMMRKKVTITTVNERVSVQAVTAISKLLD